MFETIDNSYINKRLKSKINEAKYYRPTLYKFLGFYLFCSAPE